MQRTDEQSAIISSVTSSTDNIMINALAGSGKTTTLEMIERETSIKPVLYLVFNKRNAEEATKRMLTTTTVRTFNSLGHRIWAQACARKQLKLNPKKSPDILRALISEAPKSAQGAMWDAFWDVIHGVSLAKALGYIPENKFPTGQRLIPQAGFHSALEERPDDLVSDLIDAVLTRSITQSYDGLIDYNDQIYMPALFGGTYPRFPLVMVDECQDLSPVNHAMLKRLVKGRLCAVGDRWQSIYAFRGADTSSMDRLAEGYAPVQSDLSISFRCPSEIVKHVHWRVPNFKWIREGGSIEQPTRIAGADIEENAAIICRNNAPLFKMALHLLSAGRSVSVAGSDVGPKLVGLLRKLGDESLSRASVLSAIADWQVEREAKNSTTAADMADCMRVFASKGENLGQAIAYAEHVLGQKTGSIRLLTGHKAKGLEWNTVYHLDKELLRSDEQDKNLSYVIATRSKDRLIEISSRDIVWQ